VSYATAIDQRRAPLWWWIEIEGLPYALGNFAAPVEAFAGRARPEQFDAILPWATKPPRGFDQEVDVLAGSASVGQMDFEFLDRGGRDGLPSLASLLGLAMAGTVEPLELAASVYEGLGFWPVSGVGLTEWPLTATAYCGKETVAVYRGEDGSAILHPTVRGLYRSIVAAHGEGSIVTSRPRTLGQRKVWVWYWVGELPGDRSVVVADASLRFVGTVTAASRTTGAGGPSRLGSSTASFSPSSFMAASISEITMPAKMRPAPAHPRPPRRSPATK
jgi:hypothetical protein